ncbi:phospholipase D-like domain-containing protein [Streptomyces sp. G35A]
MRAPWADSSRSAAATGSGRPSPRPSTASRRPGGACGSLTRRVHTGLGGLRGEVRVWHRAVNTGVLHAKLIAADRHTAFLGSANLTDRALSHNIELGVLLRDPSTVEPLVDHFRWLLAPENNAMRFA